MQSEGIFALLSKIYEYLWISARLCEFPEVAGAELLSNNTMHKNIGKNINNYFII